MNGLSVICPKCKAKISLDQALSNELEEKIKIGLRSEFNQKWVEEKKKLEDNASLKLKEEFEQELKLLKEENEKKSQELQKAQELELKIRKEKNQLEEERKNFELEKQRQLDEERKTIEDKIAGRMLEEHRLRDKEKEKIINDLKKSLEDAQRKATQGSQQLQGEVLELELESLLKNEFPQDEIIPVPKGVSGADVLQKVYDSFGRHCGTIIWESKRTKNWSDGWIAKLKDDMRSSKADVAILVSSILPSDIKNFGPSNGIFISNFESLLGITYLTRTKLIDLYSVKSSNTGQNEKKEVIYNYLRGNEFKQRVEAVIEALSSMKNDLEKEKQLYLKVWSKREKQMSTMVENILGMHGDLAGLMGESLPEIKQLDQTFLLSDSSEIDT